MHPRGVGEGCDGRHLDHLSAVHEHPLPVPVPGHTLNPPVGNLAPAINDPANQDPHGDPRATPAAQLQISDYLQPNGSFVNVCANAPCHSYDYTP